MLRASLVLAAARLAAAAPMNVLYLLSDDMRADIGAYGLPTVTPHLDALAATGLRFTHAFCQVSVCSPSRQSFLTGRRPDRSQVWNFIDANPIDAPATPRLFRDAGYLTLGAGKGFHENAGCWNAANVWSNRTAGKAAGAPWCTPYSTNTCPPSAHASEGGGHCVVTAAEELALYDYTLRVQALADLSAAAANLAATGQPFFQLVGFRDPHAPWAAPQRMYDLYNESAIKGPAHPVIGEGTPLIAWSDQLSVQLANGTAFPFSPTHAVPDFVQRDQRHAYYAAVSYVDEHVGAILAALEEKGLANSTIVVFHADHGYQVRRRRARARSAPRVLPAPRRARAVCAQLTAAPSPLHQLGEHGMWEKKSNWDLAVRVPLIVRVPGRAAAAGAVTRSFVDLVDVMPTLAALAGLPPPAGIDGDDMSALFDAPATVLKTEAFHQYPACGMAGVLNRTRDSCNNTPRTQFDFMGYSMRNADWRYTVWLPWRNETLTAEWDAPAGAWAEELYAHTGDESTSMDAWENVNAAAASPAVAAALRARVRAFFDHAW
jgi:arylsulfatase A-like enzyme